MKKLILFAKGMTILIGLVAFFTGSAFADIVISNGTEMRVSAAATVKVSHGVNIQSGGTLTNNGIVTVSGDFTNDGGADLGSGSIVMDGSATQYIDGSTTSEFEDLEIDNNAGVTLSVHAQVNGTLTLTDGLLTIGSNNLLFASGSTAVAGSPSSSNMIVASGTGQVRKLYPTGAAQNPSSFIFPIGDASDYTPISLDFNLVDVAAGGFAGINLTTAKEPNNTSLTNYINRYWTLETTGLTNYNYDFTATYADGDIVGTEADMSGALFDGSGWLIGNVANAGSNQLSGNSFNDDGNITGVEFRILANIGLVCEGAYNSTTDEMTTSINSILPLDAATAYSHMGYAGTESVAAIPSADIVDWILIEVRDATTPANATSATSVETVAGFLMRDGSIVGIDGVSPVSFRALIVNNAYFVVYHRNHLELMTATSPSESFGNYAYDFSSNMASAYGTNAMIQVDTSPVVYAMYCGELNGSGTITNSDKGNIDGDINVSGYLIGDTNFSGTVTNADKQFIDSNMNESTQVPN